MGHPTELPQDTSHKLYMLNVILAGNLILVSIIVLSLDTFYAKQLYKIGPWS